MLLVHDFVRVIDLSDDMYDSVGEITQVNNKGYMVNFKEYKLFKMYSANQVIRHEHC